MEDTKNIDFDDRILEAYRRGQANPNRHEMAPETENEFTKVKALLKETVIKQDKMEAFISRVSWVVFSALLGTGAWVGVIQTKVANNTEDISDHQAEIRSLVDTQRSNELVVTEVRTRLIGIEATLKDIKVSLNPKK